MQRDGLNVPGLSGPLGKDGQRMAKCCERAQQGDLAASWFVVKTKDEKRGGRKVFINICQHEDIKNFSKRCNSWKAAQSRKG